MFTLLKSHEEHKIRLSALLGRKERSVYFTVILFVTDRK